MSSNSVSNDANSSCAFSTIFTASDISFCIFALSFALHAFNFSVSRISFSMCFCLNASDFALASHSATFPIASMSCVCNDLFSEVSPAPVWTFINFLSLFSASASAERKFSSSRCASSSRSLTFSFLFSSAEIASDLLFSSFLRDNSSLFISFETCSNALVFLTNSFDFSSTRCFEALNWSPHAFSRFSIFSAMSLSISCDIAFASIAFERCISTVSFNFSDSSSAFVISSSASQNSTATQNRLNRSNVSFADAHFMYSPRSFRNFSIVGKISSSRS